MTGIVQYQNPDLKTATSVSNTNPLPVALIAGEGGGASGVGSPDDPAWNGSDASASLISIMKAIYAQNAMIAMEVNEIDTDMDTVMGLLQDIKTNTTPTP